MKRIWVFAFLFIFSHAAFAENFLDKKAVKIGEPVGDFELPDLEGGLRNLAAQKGKIVMLHFWSATCPFVVRYEGRLQAIAADYAGKDVVVWGIDSNASENSGQMRAVAKERGVNYPVLVDQGNRVADHFGAITTPHVYILDREGKLAYEGSVDDQGWNENDPVRVSHVRDALEALLAGKPVPNFQTKTFGCTVKRA